MIEGMPATMKSAVLALGLFLLLPAAALAGSCAEDVKALDAALATAQLEPDVKAQLQDMRNQADKLCAAGNEEEAADVLSEAASILEGQ